MLDDFLAPQPRPLPVFLLVDTSGSMNENSHMALVNRALGNLIEVLAQEDHFSTEIQLAVITFGGREPRVHQDLRSARSVVWTPLEAKGHTPLGQAINLVREMIEDPSLVSKRSYTPTLVVVSDGIPNDEDVYLEALKSLFASPRAGRAHRMAMFIGDDREGEEILRLFLNDPKARLFKASDAKHIHDFFQKVSLSVTRRSRSVNPQHIPDDDFEII